MSGLSTSQATTTSVSRSRGSSWRRSTTARSVRATPPGRSGRSAAVRKRAPRAAASPVPPSVVALPPMPRTTRCTRSSSAAATSSPVPQVDACRGSGRPPGSWASPDAVASSTTAVRGATPSGESAKDARTGAPVGPVTVRSRRTQPDDSTTATVPSPPSATGRLPDLDRDPRGLGGVAQPGLDRRRRLVRGQAPRERVGGDDHGHPGRCGHTVTPALSASPCEGAFWWAETLAQRVARSRVVHPAMSHADQGAGGVPWAR